MPALLPVPGALKASFQHLSDGIPAWVHWYFGYSGTAPLAADAATLANGLKSAWVTNLAPMCATHVTLNLVQVTDLASPTGGQGISGGTAVGTRAGGPLTANDCTLVNLHINRRYRGGKPRQYWPFGVQLDLANTQSWNATYVTNMNAAWNAMQTAALALTWTGGNITRSINISWFGPPNKVVISPTTGRAKNMPTPRATPLVDTIVSATTNARVATQRRRQHFSA